MTADQGSLEQAKLDNPTSFASLHHCLLIGVTHVRLKEAIDLAGVYTEDEFGAITSVEMSNLPEVYEAIAKDLAWKKSAPHSGLASGVAHLLDISGKAVLQRYGWHEKLLPDFDNLDLPKVNKTRLRVEGRLVKILTDADFKIDFEALGSGDTVEYQKILKVTEGKIDRKTVAKILDRWNLRPIQAKTSPIPKS